MRDREPAVSPQTLCPPPAGPAAEHVPAGTPPILMVGNFLSVTTGARGACEDISAQLAARGWTVLTTSSKRGRCQRLLDMARSIHRWRRAYALAHVEVYSGAAFCWAEVVCWLLRRLRKPYVLTLHGGNLPAHGRRWPQRVHRLLAPAAAVTAPSSYLLEQMCPYRSGLQLVPNAVEVEHYPFRIREAPRPRVVWLRAFAGIYNPPLAVRALGILAQEYPGIRMTMVGPDKRDGSLQQTRQTAEALAVGDQVRFVGAVPKADVPSWLDEADIFLNTTDFDNTPVSVIEAMACGLCVVSTNVGGIPYLLADGRNGLLVPPRDPAAMAAAVSRLLSTPGLGGSLSVRAREDALRFSWSSVLPQWEALFTSVFREHPNA